MKTLLAGLLVICGLQFAKAEEAVPVEQKIVELHITLKAKPEAEAKYRKKTQNLPQVEAGHAVCSGAFVSNMGDIITAGHCTEEAAEIEVVTYDRRTYTAVIVATSAIHDLALIHIDRRETAAFQAAPVITRGEKVFILGSPLAITDALSTGIVAKLDGDLLMLDCSALPGNSGSPVFDNDGNMVGVLTAVAIAGFGLTHLSIAQNLDAVFFFLARAAAHIRQ